MKKSITGTVRQSRAAYEVLEEMVRLKIQGYIQDMLEEGVETFLDLLRFNYTEYFQTNTTTKVLPRITVRNQ